VLYGVSYFNGITALIGVIIAHMKVDDTDPVLRSHYQFQIRTFWIGLLWWFVWSLIRIVKGFLLVTEHKPIVNPRSWLFG
jgi:uncharacterized membrane protein